jgi:hypothetical protein
MENRAALASAGASPRKRNQNQVIEKISIRSFTFWRISGRKGLKAHAHSATHHPNSPPNIHTPRIRIVFLTA